MPLNINQRDINQVLPKHVNPFPVYPARQVHAKLPKVFVQMAHLPQLALFTAHSLMSG